MKRPKGPKGLSSSLELKNALGLSAQNFTPKALCPCQIIPRNHQSEKKLKTQLLDLNFLGGANRFRGSGS